MSDPQLERSVLESKDREELFAIAEALGARPTSRAKKSDLVTQILRSTGVEETPADEEDKPRRTRARKAAGPAQQAPPGAEAPKEPSVDHGGPAGGPAVESAGGAPAAPSASDAAAPAISAPAAALAPEPAVPPTASSAPAAGQDTGTDASGQDQNAPGRNGGEGRNGGQGRNGQGQSGPARGQGGGGQGPANGSPQNPATRPSGSNPAPAVSGAGGHGGVKQADNGQDRSGGRPEGEPGNRRNRRRRGRDRSERGGDRELQGAPSEPTFTGEPTEVKGLLDLRDEGYGFVRTDGYLAGPDDAYVSISQVRRFALRRGDMVEGTARPAGSNEKYRALARIDKVSDHSPEEAQNRVRFESLTPLFPDAKLHLEVPGDAANLTARIVDLISPIGKGQRGLIVSPPKAGKTTVLKQIAHSIEANNPDVHLMVLLVDERPEEVTDMRRSVKGEVVASTFDRPAEEHTQVAELVIERAKRLVEMGRDVVVVLDGITRLARAYNLAQPATGRVMSGGIDTGALYPPKKFFGAARNIEEGGSLTILATALVETGSRMDEVIFEEFKGTGNMELKLDRRLAERRVYPAIDVNGSSTRHEELLFDRKQLEQVWKLRRVLGALASEGTNAASLELLMEKIRQTKSNDEFLAEIAKNPAPAV
ncbi:MAG: transcription termination factor Rho [Actinomycetota bacterium]|nr:transcription termination factor Rho [Actinomycetota bacterium]